MANEKIEPTFHEACRELDIAVQELKSVLYQEGIDLLQTHYYAILLAINVYLTIVIALYALGIDVP